jgi:hypothetical protein
MYENYKVFAEKFKYQITKNIRYSPLCCYYVVIHIEGPGCGIEDFAAWEDLTNEMADAIMIKVNGEVK